MAKKKKDAVLAAINKLSEAQLRGFVRNIVEFMFCEVIFGENDRQGDVIWNIDKDCNGGDLTEYVTRRLPASVVKAVQAHTTDE